MFRWNELSDDQVAEAIAGSTSAQAAVMEALAGQVKAMVAVRLAATPGQSHLVEDLSQQALIAILESFSKIKRPSVVALKGFASTIVTRKVCDFLRSRKSQRQGLSLDSTVHFLSTNAHWRDVLPASDTTPRSRAGRAELLRLAHGELKHMKDSYQQVLTLALVDQLPVSEICTQMGLSRAATSMLLFRAMRALKKRVTKPNPTRTVS